MIYERILIQPGVVLGSHSGSTYDLATADLVLGANYDGTRFRVLKDRYGAVHNRLTIHHPCPCGSGRRLGTCHARNV